MHITLFLKEGLMNVKVERAENIEASVWWIIF